MSDQKLIETDRAEAIATAWHQTLAENGDLPESPSLVQPELIEITRQIIALSSEDKFHTEDARAIGGRLAQLGYQRVDVIGNAPAILSQHLTQGLDPGQVNTMHMRLGNVLTQVIAGFLEQQHQAALVELERTLQVYEARWKRLTADHEEIEQKSQAILQALPDALGIINLDGEVLYYQAGSERVLTNREIVSFKHIRQYLPAVVADEMLSVFRSVNATGQAQIYEYSVTFEDIGKRYFQDKITPYNGNSVLVIGRDITKQKQIEEDQRASEARYRSVVETQTELICRFDRQGVVTFFNDAGYRMFKEAGREIIGHNILEFLQDIDPAANLEAVTATFNLTPNNPSLSTELRVLGPGQQIMVLGSTTRAIFDDQGEVVEYQTIARDITDLKRIEAALRESEARYRSVVEGQTEFIVRFSPDATITFVNEAFCRFFSKSRQDIIGSYAMDLIYRDDQSDVAEGLSDLINNPPVDPIPSYQTRVVLPSGEIRWLESTTRPIYNADGTFSEYQSVARDVTDLKQAQETLEQQNELLRQLGDQLINIQEVERQRIARDLHDSVLNELGAMMIAPAERLTPIVVRNNYEQLIEKLRQTINGLRSPMLNYGLYAALDDLFDNMVDNPQVDSVLKMDVPASQARFALNVELHLFRIIQQACDNALQHAHAPHIHIYGEIDERCVKLTVEDDGIGFQLGAETDLAHVLAQKHFGLVSMLERGKLIGADVQISSHPRAGTKVKVLWEPKKD